MMSLTTVCLEYIKPLMKLLLFVIELLASPSGVAWNSQWGGVGGRVRGV